MIGKEGIVMVVLFVLLLNSSIILAAPSTPSPLTPIVPGPSTPVPSTPGPAIPGPIVPATPDSPIVPATPEAPLSPPSAPPPWLNTAMIAISIAMILLAITYMIGYGFGVDPLKAMAKDELFQLIALALVIAVFFGANNIVNMISTAPELAGEQANMQTTALLSINSTIANLSQAYSYVADADKKTGSAASQAVSCQLANIGYSVSGCGGFSMLSSPFSLAGSILGFAIGEMNALYKLIELALFYALPLFLPFGIILRTFRVTRGAGGFLIAMAVSLHILLPMGILFVDMMGDSFLASPEASEYNVALAPLSGADLSAADIVEGLSTICRPGDVGDTNPDRAIGIYDSLRKDLKSYIFLALIKGTFGPLVAVLMMVSGIRFLTSLAGAEVDVSALGRLV